MDLQTSLAQMMMGIPMMMAPFMQQQQSGQNHPFTPIQTFEWHHTWKTSLSIILSSNDAPIGAKSTTSYPLISD